MRLPSLVIIWLSIGCALVLQVMPMPLLLDAWRPNWLLMTTVYWCLALPHRFNVGSAWLSGLLIDALWGTALGVNAVIFALVCAVVIKNFQRIRSYSVWHQALILALLSFSYQWFSYVLQHLLFDVTLATSYYFPVFTSLLFWPWVFFLLRKTRRHWAVT